jgi:hypothetical protein
MPAAGQPMHHHIQEQLWQPSGSDLLGAGRFWVGLFFFFFFFCEVGFGYSSRSALLGSLSFYL